MKRASTLLISVGLVTVLAACAADKEAYPSLSRRPIERIIGTGQPVAAPAPPVPQPLSPEISRRLVQLVDQGRDAHQRFSTQRGRTEQLVAAGARTAVASESWSVASVALAGLESARSDAMIALAELDTLYAATRIEGGDGAAIAAARDQVDAWVAEEDRVLTALRAQFD